MARKIPETITEEEFVNELVDMEWNGLIRHNLNSREVYGEEKRIMRKSSNLIENYYIFPLLMKNQKGRCNKCKRREKLELHHKRYAWDLKLEDYELLCKKCHFDITEFQMGR